jgi:hypothetical protein
MSDIKFIDGLIVKAPHERAPDFVKARLSIKREELIAWLQAQEGEWVNAEVKVSKGGKWYAAVDERKPQQRGEAPAPRAEKPAGDRQLSDDDIPF